MSHNYILKVAVLAGALLGTVSAQSSSAEPSLYNGLTHSNSKGTISADPTSATPFQNSTSICASCSFPPRSIRTAPIPSFPSTTSEASTTSTVFTTVTYTIPSCKAEVTNCPIWHITTESVALYVTVCPIGTPAPSLPVRPTGTEHPIYSSFFMPPGASPIPTYLAPHGIATNAGVVATPHTSSSPINEATAVIKPSKAAPPMGNSTITISHEPMPPLSTSAKDLTTKIADSNVVTKTADGVVASTGPTSSTTTCAAPTCTEWISAASKMSVGVFRQLDIVDRVFAFML
ncbi:hypothetical protein IFR05_011368 [Cadophora sp. M221]|nr:hypothetical protein IFR05_011368 [Cadophora sp. M221]